MDYSIKDRVTICFILGIIVFGLVLIQETTKADEPTPSKADYQNLEDIKSNQKVLEKNREAYNRFMEAKLWNEEEVRQLNANGWNVDWETMELVPLKTPEKVHAAAFIPHAEAKEGMIDLSQFGEKTRLTDQQLVSILKDAGFEGQGLKIAIAVARAESGARPKAYNNNPKTRDLSYGIFQINMKGVLGPDRRKRYSLPSNEALYQPEINAKIAYHMSKGGKNWGPWGAYTNGSYRHHLASASSLLSSL